MGYLKFPTVRTYWSQNEIDNHPIFGKTISRHRYETILSCLCFYQPNLVDHSDRLHKISNVTNHIINNIRTKYYPNENLSLDESLLLWRGRLSFRQYIPSKAHKYGIVL